MKSYNIKVLNLTYSTKDSALCLLQESS